jgi:demethylspheroidene O-methyltransferase
MMRSVAPMPPAAPLRAGWHDRWLGWRDRLLASPAFQRAAARFLPTRPIARRRAGELFDLVAGFVYSQVLLACVRLGLFQRLFEAPCSAQELAQRCAVPEPAMQRLLDAAVALRLLERRSHDRYGLGRLGAPMVGNRAIAAMVEHHAALYADLHDPVALLRGAAPELSPGRSQDSSRPPGGQERSDVGAPELSPGRSQDSSRPPGGQERSDVGANQLAAYWPYAAADDPASLAQDRVADYSALMAASQPLVADQILDAYLFHRHRRLLDVGGGDGTFLCAAAARAPALQLMLFDLPAVAERARANIAAQGLAQRCSVTGGDFRRDPLPPGADLATLIRVVHDHDDASALAILGAVHQALSPGGRLLLAEPMAATSGAEAMGDAYFGIYLFAMGRGRPRSAAQLALLLKQAGFGQVRRLRTAMPLQTGLLQATRMSA